MHISNDPELIQYFLDQHHINKYFSTDGLHFLLLHYAKNEIINSPLKSNTYLQFICAGSVSIYAIHADGNHYQISTEDSLALLGDMEFINQKHSPFFVEALSDVFTIALPLKKYAPSLHKDTRFLHLLLYSLAQKIELISSEQLHTSSLEQTLLFHLHHNAYDHSITHVGQTAEALHCSRRQLQRILYKLTQEKKLIKTAKGHYQLSQ